MVRTRQSALCLSREEAPDGRPSGASDIYGGHQPGRDAGPIPGDRDSQPGGPALDELIAAFDEVNGPADPVAVADKQARLTAEPRPGAGAAV
ncbi:hypothetical protein SSOG_04851 [Streptomyces himastatinicus ATCC 53653]|uniref:Uncharacterized protein n=1 Tax=Streptomyces himastatinicus ATCC 53653 TaxID=457427 RepID=D9WD75_9ACTN|nr:hypothetical protein [Streptomyces himastatinicus]EFL25137.1 hypothetical protein SSOG_04851 [Streptomyces himastatinicus ATCC 53653]